MYLGQFGRGLDFPVLRAIFTGVEIFMYLGHFGRGINFPVLRAIGHGYKFHVLRAILIFLYLGQF